MTEKLPKLERRLIWRLIQHARARTARRFTDPTVNALQDEIRRVADELAAMLRQERFAK